MAKKHEDLNLVLYNKDPNLMSKLYNLPIDHDLQSLSPCSVICPVCHEHVSTKVRCAPNMRTHLLAITLCIFCCWGCAIIPYCIRACNDFNHYCPRCEHLIGTYHRFF